MGEPTVKVVPTFTFDPLNVGTDAPKNDEATQRPAGVPEKLASSTTTSATRPDGANVTVTCPVPTCPLAEQ